ncbi:MAG TPA: NAD-dependent epimerase/dehydratase family protein [Kofleriaceae bacterium]|nr:NAD-dependent epimerase/dehydratase family protein [Kofleriaceae bacterium]
MIAVTGGAGFIGSHVVDHVLAAGHEVVVLDNFSTGKRSNLPKHDNLHVNVCDVAHGIFAALAPYRIERIVHLAAQVSVVTSIANPLSDMAVNYGGTLHVLEYARAMGVAKVVFASSAAVYGDAAELPVGEDAACRPVSPYGIHKLASEHALAYYGEVHGVSTAALRFFNVYGPRQDPTSPYSGVISIFTDRARAGTPLLIYGDGGQTRDFVYVGDVVRGIAAALESRERHVVANLGTGGAISVLELARSIVELCGNRSQIVHAEARSGEILHSRARVDRLRDRLGVVAQTQLVDGLRATLG